MPRIYTGASDPIDFCVGCMPNNVKAWRHYGVIACGEGPDGRGDCYAYGAEHPPYDEFENYACEMCGKRLTERDN